ELLGEDGKMSFEDALHIIQPILRDLKKVHETGFIHRDIAPDNIFITNEGEAKLLDFGSARYIALAQSKSLSVIIKTGYAPPEQYQTHGNQGTWTDVYSLAATMYRMITGIPPEDAMERIAEDHLQAPSRMGVSIPKDQETAILNALNTNVGSRTKTLEDFENELLSKVAVIRQKDGKKEKKSSGKRTLFSMIAAAAVILLIGGA
ncbi:MAG: protein kinase, partial [Clostridiales bacterium]|nr:protein kinase [Clostridiales bacterium]